ncbi:universal stress protein [Mangrovibacterium diazotrophicum]|uniref:Nucleotide-binding universal stress UspA family protein n=1 Tax=Mangrovibacterium diazotrophicum TaxID=1261403 RepID=A0A419W6M4_9BACT|nr:universal stress protein [Mangrovibacterium diazotrophicum]RKD91121.1 nucleotide-binding universal stress UspA family protein [Mangrovibacterium diazotrophicum]
MKKILVFAYPFNQIERIVDYSVRFARDLGLPLEFVHVVEEPVIPADPMTSNFNTGGITADTVPNDFVENRSRVLQKVLSIKNASMEIPVSYSFKVVPGSVQILAADISSRNDIEMVLVPNLPDQDSNQPSIDLIEGTDHPVYAFPLESEYHPIRKIVYASDYNEKDMEVVKHLSNIARKVVASITVFHVNKDDKYEAHLKNDGFREQLEQNPALRGIEVTETKSEKIVRGIKDFSKRNYADLVVLLKENKNFIREFFGKSTTKDLVKDSPIPVLIYHES